MEMKIRLAVLGLIAWASALLIGCNATTTTTDVPRAVATLVKQFGAVDTGRNTCFPATPPSPDIQAFWNGLTPINRTFPLVGFETWRNTTDGCLESRLDMYRALVTFNMASVSNLKGLVTKAELIVSTRALPPGVGAPSCIAVTGGAGSLQRFGPAAAGSLPIVSAAGSLDQLQPTDPFPSGPTVFTFPSPWAAGPVAGAASPTVTALTGLGGAVFTVDVTSQVNAALNDGSPGMSWMLTGSLEAAGPIAPVTLAVDCKTSYNLVLRLTHY